MRSIPITVFFCLGVIQQLAAQIDLPDDPPRGKAELFAPHLISAEYKRHSKISVSPDGQSIYWAYVNLKEMRRYAAFMTRSDGNWGEEKLASFNSNIDTDSPCFLDNNRMIYHAVQWIDDDSTKQVDDLWLIEKHGNSWSNPIPLGFDKHIKLHRMPMLSIAENGNLYFNGAWDEGAYKLGIYFSEYRDGMYTMPVLLPHPINTEHLDWCPFIARDESYMIFTSSRHGKENWSSDLYISFKNEDGSWAEPMNMGESVNSAEEERFASVTPDGKTMFFMRGANEKAEYWWIDAYLIDRLKDKHLR